MHLVGFHYTNVSRCTVLRMSNKTWLNCWHIRKCRNLCSTLLETRLSRLVLRSLQARQKVALFLVLKLQVLQGQRILYEESLCLWIISMFRRNGLPGLSISLRFWRRWIELAFGKSVLAFHLHILASVLRVNLCCFLRGPENASTCLICFSSYAKATSFDTSSKYSPLFNT